MVGALGISMIWPQMSPNFTKTTRQLLYLLLYSIVGPIWNCFPARFTGGTRPARGADRVGTSQGAIFQATVVELRIEVLMRFQPSVSESDFPKNTCISKPIIYTPPPAQNHATDRGHPRSCFAPKNPAPGASPQSP